MFVSRIVVGLSCVALLTAPSMVAGGEKAPNRTASYEKASTAPADEKPIRATAASSEADADDAPLNIPTPTLGGAEVWGDELFFGKWRIQRNALTEHWRFLDAGNRHRAWAAVFHRAVLTPHVFYNYAGHFRR